MNPYERGSEWRLWDLHIHTPASFHWDGARFGADQAANTALVDEMISAMTEAKPAVFALMDYWTFDGWFALKQRLAEPGAPRLEKTVFPGIELRLAAPMPKRLNAHVIFSDKTPEQDLRDFQANLRVEIAGRPLSNQCLIEVARCAGEDKLRHHGINKAEIDRNDEKALLAGSAIAEINCDSYIRAIAEVPNGAAIGFMPFDTNDGLEQVDWREHYAYVLNLFKSSPIFESRDPDVRGAFVNEVTAVNATWIKNFRAAIQNVSRLAVSGSDAHRFRGVANNNNRRGYGDFPSGKATWIKADPTFRGLRQAIMEPAKRSYIGECPPKLAEIDQNKTFYIDAIESRRLLGCPAETGVWLDGCRVPLNSDLVAIIGNKGSGKSALADIIALSGNSRQKAHFAFLKKDRFRGKSGDPAKHFTSKMIWRDTSEEERNLNDDPPPDKAELVRYIPQGHFEGLCNDHVSGRSDAFERELRSVIVSHADDSIRLGALDFDQLISQQESGFRDRLGELRKELGKLNEAIASIEDQLQPNVRRHLQELLALKNKQIEEHRKIEPAAVPKPTDRLTPDQTEAATELDAIAAKLKDLDTRATARSTETTALARKQKAVQNVQERLRILERAVKQFGDETLQDLTLLGLTAQDIISFQVTKQPLDLINAGVKPAQDRVAAEAATDATERTGLDARASILRAKLNEPQLAYQANVKARTEWTAALDALVGSADSPDTLKGLETRVTQIDALPTELATRKETRLNLAGEIFDVLEEQRQARAKLYKPVHDLIDQNSLIRDDYKLQFQATLSASPDAIADSLFALVKQQSGEFRGDDESVSAVRRVADQHDLTSRDGTLGFVTALIAKVELAGGSGAAPIGIRNALRKDKLPNEVYDLLFGLSFLEPRYTLLFQDTQIEHLSPGQRGALLLIFYLLVDKGHTPIILDQPEENLDNQTVVRLLVPVLTEAKKKRQIIMVTHNPNLAVVCDAEQIIYSHFSRKDDSTITYLAGAIENPVINPHVVNVLEGTKPAFDNRSMKYP